MIGKALPSRVAEPSTIRRTCRAVSRGGRRHRGSGGEAAEEFTTGRLCAGRALAQLGLPSLPVTRGETGGPRWQKGSWEPALTAPDTEPRPSQPPHCPWSSTPNPANHCLRLCQAR
ncbi:hypothetical protein [Nonomuraea recticatena]|uniref:hypothetical protein n=1 Tax=Nonomuraea recticatena TaxID=46178 RepID=UPI003612F33E